MRQVPYADGGRPGTKKPEGLSFLRIPCSAADSRRKFLLCAYVRVAGFLYSSEVMQLTYLTVKCALLLLISGAALFFDLRTGKIPNALILFGLSAGFVCRTAVLGMEGMTSCLMGAGFPFLILFLLFRLGMMGAGDIKLLMAAGGLLGWPGSLRFFVLSIFFGSLVSVIVFVRRVRFSDRAGYFRAYVREALLDGKISRYRMEGERPENIHFALPVFLAAAAETALELTALYGLIGMTG